MNLERALVSQLPSMHLNITTENHWTIIMTHTLCMRSTAVNKDLIGPMTMKVTPQISMDITEITEISTHLEVDLRNTINMRIANSEEAHTPTTLNSNSTILKSNSISSQRLPLRNILNKRIQIRSNKLRYLKMLQSLRSYPLPQANLNSKKNNLSKSSRQFKARTTRNFTLNIQVVMLLQLKVHTTMPILKKLAILTLTMMSIAIMLMRRGT